MAHATGCDLHENLTHPWIGFEKILDLKRPIDFREHSGAQLKPSD
jgi:hypothetical protein